MIAKRLNTPIRNYAQHYVLWRDWSIKDKTNVLLNSKMSDLYFIYEPTDFKYYWDILITNGSHLNTRIATLSRHLSDNSNEFKINPENTICDPTSKKSILFIVFVILAPDHFEKRDLIRSTWGNKSISPDFKLIFTIGMSKDEQINRRIEDEYFLHKDILQIDNFIDSYFNITTKIMKSLKWISQYCSNAKYILRINDDVVVNTYHLIDHFKNLQYEKNQIFGYRIFGVGPVRFKDDKFYVSEQEYNRSIYDDYIEGIFL